MKNSFLMTIIAVFDFMLMPFTFASALLFLAIRRMGMRRMLWSKKLFLKIGVFPIRDHYYEPLFNPKHLRASLRQDRSLPGINMNDSEQLAILKRFNFNDELTKIPLEQNSELGFYYHNPSIGLGDAEYFYNMIRLFKPKKIVEIGSGYSTLMCVTAVKQNKIEDPTYTCEIICVEPYEMVWLEKLGLNIIREKVEVVDKKIFIDLAANDILFVDSSHMIRPQGDVLFEYLEIMPVLKPGVLVHIHDIFTPKDYLDEWVLVEMKLWNEQYLLEAFLSLNKDYRIIGALNYLKHHFPNELFEKCPILKKEANEEPCSFWVIRN